jgi:hypothetical protein
MQCVHECLSQRCVLQCAVRIQHRTVWVSTVCWANTAGCEYSQLGKYCKLSVQSVGQRLQAVSTVFWANTAGCKYSPLGKHCRLWVQSVGQILQIVNTVCWANTASCEYSLLGKCCRLWVQSVGQILQAVSTVCWANTISCKYSLLGKCSSCATTLSCVEIQSVNVQVELLFGTGRRVAPTFRRSLSCLSSG